MSYELNLPSGKKLTEEGESLFGDWLDRFDGDCSCHIAPPCGSCTHPGNPMNLNEDESLWEEDDDTAAT